MSTPSPLWDTHRVYGTWDNFDQTRKEGRYTVQIGTRVANAEGDVIVPAGEVDSGPLNVENFAAPSLDLLVPANNDPSNSPLGWVVVVTVTFHDAAPERYVLETPLGEETNLRQIVLPQEIAAQEPGYLRGVAGGVAALDVDGNVVNSDGDVVGLVESVDGDIGAVSTDAAVAARVSDEDTATGAALAGMFPQLVAGRKYKFLSCALRNDGSGWYAIDDANHRPANVDSVSNDTSEITVNYPSMAGLKMVGFNVTSDEILTQNGITAGASVAQTQAKIRLSRTGSITDYVAWTDPSWVSQNGFFTIDSFTSGVLTLSHKSIGSRFNGMSFTPRGATYRVVASASANPLSTRVSLEFIDSAGVKATVPNTNMRVYVSRHGGSVLDPNEVTTVLYPTSNLWVIGVFEVA